MHVDRRDVVATLAVAVATAAYLLWLADVELPGLASPRSVGLLILVLGFVASASAVVPGFETLIHGSRTYLTVTSALGLVALVAGIIVLVNGSEAMLATLAGATVVLWCAATVRHVRAARATSLPAVADVVEREPVGARR
jgi:uncharacterized membrane protein HdeD (DUF308 family)